jgi:hypothetical protein
MHIFICESKDGSLKPTTLAKQKFLLKLLNSYQEQNIRFKITIENISKDLNEAQMSLYKAFVVKVSDYYGNTYSETEQILTQFFPIDILSDNNKYLAVADWKSADLDIFLSKSISFIDDDNFKF